jgi:hypothetical protein
MGDDIEAEVRELLSADSGPATKHVLHNNPALVAAIRYFLELKAAGDPSASMGLPWLYRNGLRDKFDGPRWYGTVRAYVRDVMKLDPSTGEAL